MVASDLVDLQVAKAAAPKPVGANSVPGMLNHLQNEWDTLMLEVYTLKQNLDQARKELSHALYQHDAACQVICRLLGEKEQLLAQLEENQIKTDELRDTIMNQAAAPAQQSVEVEETKQQVKEGIDKDLVKEMEELSDKLIQQRRQTKAPKDYPTKKELGAMKVVAESDLKTKDNQGIVEVSMADGAGAQCVVAATGTELAVYDTEKNATVQSNDLGSSVKAIGVVRYFPNSAEDVIIASAENNSVQQWNVAKAASEQTITASGEIATDVTFTPLAGFVIIASRDGSWSLYDLQNKRVLNSFRESAPISQIQIHPDGLVLAIGLANGKVLIYDIRDLKAPTELEPPKEGTPVSKLTFSNKGVYLAAAWEGLDLCRVYSLHKECAFTDLSHAGKVVSSLAFDAYGGFLMTSADQEVRLFHYKNWKEPFATLDLGFKVSSAV